MGKDVVDAWRSSLNKLLDCIAGIDCDVKAVMLQSRYEFCDRIRLIDEAYQLNVAEVKRISGIGRGRGVGLGLGYQDLPQMYDQYGREQANAILGTVMTKIFLPGLDDVTAEYASKQLGDTTIFSKTFQDSPGKNNDHTRHAEQKRSLMHASEIRQIARHTEVLIVSDTAPPIRVAYPPLAVMRNGYVANRKGAPRELHLGDIDRSFLLTEPTEARSRSKEDQENLMNVVSTEVDRVFTDETIIELLAAATEPLATGLSSSEVELDGPNRVPGRLNHSGALDNLTADLRLMLADKYERTLSPV